MRPILAGAVVLSSALALLGACAGTSPEQAGPTYYGDTKAILDAKCVSCHRTGGVAPFSLATYQDAYNFRGAIRAAVASGRMPPWMPSDSCNSYHYDRSLSADQKDLVSRWAEAGGLAGYPGQATPAPPKTGELSRVDLELSMAEPYTPRNSPDDYRCFLTDWPEKAPSYITGIGIRPGNQALVHHVIVFIATPDSVASYQAQDDADPGPGYACFGGPGTPSTSRTSWAGSWVPGATGVDFPAGTGIGIAPGSKLVIQVHYNTTAPNPAPDQTVVLVKKDATVAKEAMFLPWTNPAWPRDRSLIIPAKTPEAAFNFTLDPSPFLGTLSGGKFTADKPFSIHSSALHMHTLGTRTRSVVLRQGGDTQCVLDIPRWDFHWQSQFWLKEPVTFRPGDQLRIECQYNNPGDKEVAWGEGTADEMCLGVHYITQ